MIQWRLRFLLIPCLSLAFGLSRPTRASAQTPDITGGAFRAEALGEQIRGSLSIMVLKVEKVNQDTGTITFKKTAYLKGNGPTDLVRHQIEGLPDGDRQAVFDWARSGKIAIFFQNEKVSQTCLGNCWYWGQLPEKVLAKEKGQEPEGPLWNNESRAAEPTVWEIGHILDQFPTTYVGPAEKLREHVAAILAGREVVVTAQAQSNRDSIGQTPRPVHRDWLRGKKGRVWRIKASLKIDTPIYHESEESRNFVGWGIGGPEVVPGLTRALKDSDSRVRAEAAEDLGQIGPDARDAVPHLREALNDPDAHVRVFAVEALARIDPESTVEVPVLVNALVSKDKALRNAAVGALAELGQRCQSAIPHLTATLSQDEQGDIRSAAAFALGEVGPTATRPGSRPQEVVLALARAMQHDANEDVSFWAAKVLRKFGPDARPALPFLREALKGKQWRQSDVASIAADVLARLGPVAVPVFDEALQDEECGLRSCLVEYLGEMGAMAEPVVPTLMGLLKEEDPALRQAAASALLQIDRRLAIRAVVPVLGELKGEESGRAERALLDLGALGPEAKAAVPALVKVLTGGREGYRQAAAEALGAIGPEANAAVPALRAALEDEKAGVRVAAARALWQVNRQDETAIPVLLGALKDEADWVRKEALKALKDLGPGSGKTAPCLAKAGHQRDATLLGALKDEVDRVRRQAVEALMGLGLASHNGVPCLVKALEHRDAGIRRGAAEALGCIGPEAKAAVPELRRAARDGDALVRVQAALALWLIDRQGKEAVPVLSAALKDPDLAVRLQAASALTRVDPALASRVVVPVLVEALKDPEGGSREEIVEALGAFGPAAGAAVPVLKATLKDEAPSVRVAAAVALCRVQPRNPAALLLLQQTLDKYSGWGQPVFDKLTPLGPEAKVAVPSLLRALRNEEHSVYVDAVSALQKIDPEAVMDYWGWNGPAREQQLPWANISRPRLEALWADLAHENQPKAYRTLWTLVLAGDPAIAFLEERLHPVPEVAPEVMARLLAELDSGSFAIRERATGELERFEQPAELALRRALENQPSPEVRLRVERLLERLDPARSPVQLRAGRTIEVLEHINTAKARQLLEKLAGGAPGARLTREAKASLERLTRPFINKP
jgi:HEAT repeat protein